MLGPIKLEHSSQKNTLFCSFFHDAKVQEIYMVGGNGQNRAKNNGKKCCGLAGLNRMVAGWKAHSTIATKKLKFMKIVLIDHGT